MNTASTHAEFLALAEDNKSLRSQLLARDQWIESLESKNAWLTRMMYGAKSERRSVGQGLGAAHQESFLTLPVSAAAVDAVDPDAAQATAEQHEAQAHTVELSATEKRNAKKGRGSDGKQKPKNGGGRRPVNRSLRPVDFIIEAPLSERFAADGTPFVLLGYEVSEREHYIAAELVRQVCKRQIWGLPDTRDVAFITPLPPTIVPKGKYSDETIIEAMFRKYVMLLPFGRMLGDFRALFTRGAQTYLTRNSLISPNGSPFFCRLSLSQFATKY